MDDSEGSFTRVCSNCGYQSPDEKRYCGNCGSPLADAVAPRVIVVEAQHLPLRFRPRWMRKEMDSYLASRGVPAAILILIGLTIILLNPQHCENVQWGPYPYGQSIEVCEPADDWILLAILLIAVGIAICVYATCKAIFT